MLPTNPALMEVAMKHRTRTLPSQEHLGHWFRDFERSEEADTIPWRERLAWYVYSIISSPRSTRNESRAQRSSTKIVSRPGPAQAAGSSILSIGRSEPCGTI